MNLVLGYSAGTAGCCTATWATLREAAGKGRGRMPGERSLHRAARQELAREGTRLRKTYLAARDDTLDGIGAKRRRKVLRVLTDAELRAERRQAKIARRRQREAQSRSERAREREQQRETRKGSESWMPSTLARVLTELAQPREPERAPPARTPPALRIVPPPKPPPKREPSTEPVDWSSWRKAPWAKEPS